MKVKQDYSKLQIQMAQLKKQYQDAVCQRLQLNKQVHMYMCRQYECSRTSSHVYVHTHAVTHMHENNGVHMTRVESLLLSLCWYKGTSHVTTSKEGTYSFLVKLFCISTG